jgi:hypothetical protein
MRKIIYILLLSVSCCIPAVAVTSPVDQRDMKSALIYHFSVFTDWPTLKTERFNVCTFEEDADTLNESILQAKLVANKQVRILVLHHVDELKQCQVLYLEDSPQRNNPKTLESIFRYSVLSIIDDHQAADSWGIIHLRMVDNRYQFSINIQAAKQAKLQLSAKLLTLAERIY